ncbi:MAG: glycosyltransferase family 39 protein, partial [bacterium]
TMDYLDPSWTERNVYPFSWLFMKNNFRRYHDLYFAPRMTVTALALILALSVFLTARSLFGNTAAPIAAALLCFNPEILAHAPLMTADLMTTCFFFAAFLSFTRLLASPRPLITFSAGVFTGLALLSKFTAALLFPLLILALVLSLFSRGSAEKSPPRLTLVCHAAAALAVALLILNLGYGSHRSCLPLAGSHWNSPLFSALKNSPLGTVPLPVPRLYLHAFDTQLASADKKIFTYYLNGSLSREGWYSYYWVALLLKTPLPLLIAAAAALASSFRRGARLEEKLLWLPPAAFMITFTFFVRIDLGVRYLLPIVPFLALLGAGALARVAARGRAAALAVTLLSLWYASSIFTTFGNGLAYFNELAGGPAGGSRFLLESNLDWGQNLVRLKKYLELNPSRPLLVYNYGLVPPSAYGIRDAGWVPCSRTPAVVAVSVNYLKGIDPFQGRPPECFAWLAEMKPTASLGAGLLVFDAREKNRKP